MLRVVDYDARGVVKTFVVECVTAFDEIWVNNILDFKDARRAGGNCLLGEIV